MNSKTDATSNRDGRIKSERGRVGIVSNGLLDSGDGTNQTPKAQTIL